MLRQKTTSMKTPAEICIGAWFNTPEIKTRIKSAPGLLEYIALVMEELVRKYGTTPKNLGFESLKGIGLACLVFSDIVIDPIVAEEWLVDKEMTRHTLKYVISHEFGHYMMKSEHVRIPLPRGPKWKKARRAYGEEFADKFAEKESGTTRDEANRMCDVLGWKILGARRGEKYG